MRGPTGDVSDNPPAGTLRKGDRMNRFCGITGAALLVLAAGGCETVKELAESAGRTKVSMTLKNGQKIEGTLLKDQEGQSLVQVGYGSVTVRAGDVMSVEKNGAAPSAQAGDGRLSKWDHCLEVVAGQAWGRGLSQVPATVVDLGILKNVPYLSHRSGDFEMNIYGDPDRPACLEIGLYRGGMDHSERRACIETMCLLLTDPEDRRSLRSINLEKGSGTRKGLVFEITPPTDKDAYGGWWVTVYDEGALSVQRASDAELAQITITPSQIKSPARPGATPVGIHPPSTPANPLRWQEHDLKNARPAPATTQEPRVYRRGVYRKNGVYVVLN